MFRNKFLKNALVVVAMVSMLLGTESAFAAKARTLLAPANVAAQQPDPTTAKVTFDSVVGADSYTVRLYTDKGAKKLAITATSFASGGIVSGLTSFTAYWVTVQAISATQGVTSSKESAAVAIVAPTCNHGGVCQIGETGPGGGIVYYYSTTAFTEAGAACGSSCHGLEMAPLGWAGNPATTADPQLVWSTDTASLIGASGLTLGTGFANTATMNATANSPAASAARSYNGGGKSDWFIPSSAETTGMFATAVYTLGGFTYPEILWTSSEETVAKCYYLNYTGVVTAQGTKTDTTPRVRPVRAF